MEGTRSGLWYRYADAIRILRPRLVVVENVGALLVRGLHIVLGALAEIGYDARWTCLRASDIGAPHRRERVFLVAAPIDANGGGWDGWRETQPPSRRVHRGATGASQDIADLALLPTPRTSDTNGPGEHGDGGLDLRTAVTLLPTPTSQSAKHGTSDRGSGTLDDFNLWTVATRTADWGRYAAAITRWEHITGHPAPPPTDNKNRLNPALAEWMMGLPPGWVTDILPRSPALKAIGNGVVPAQAAAAIRSLI